MEAGTLCRISKYSSAATPFVDRCSGHASSATSTRGRAVAALVGIEPEGASRAEQPGIIIEQTTEYGVDELAVQVPGEK